MKGKVLLLYRTDTLKQSFKADATRHTDDELEKMAAAVPDTSSQRRFGGGNRGALDLPTG
jgi:hypothetical protein